MSVYGIVSYVNNQIKKIKFGILCLHCHLCMEAGNTEYF